MSSLRNWTRLKRPIRILAPMEDVTDTVFRRIVAAAGAPDVFFTEFTKADDLFGRRSASALQRLRYTAVERPIVAQIWGNVPTAYFDAARWLREHGFAGIDINMGCPKRKIAAKGFCSALIENRALAAELISAAREGAGSVPVSVKTRIGTNRPATEEWVRFLLEQQLDALTIHGRTVNEMSDVPARWGEIARAVRIRNEMGVDTLMVGNGDVRSLDMLYRRADESGVDGVMVGRAIFDNLEFFSGGTFHARPAAVRIRWLRDHFELFERVWGSSMNFHALKKFVGVYVRGFTGADVLTDRIMRTTALEQAVAICDDYLGGTRC